MMRSMAMSPVVGLFLISFLVPIHADARAGVAVVVGGDVDKRTAQSLSELVGRHLRDVQEAPFALQLAPKDIDALMQCVTGEGSRECAAQFMGTIGATRAIVLRLVTEGKRRTKTAITGWILAKAGDTLVIDQRVCEPCSEAQLEPIVSELLSALLLEVKARTSNTVIEVVATPAGAQVEIDGRLVGATKVRYVVYPGPHRIKVHYLGHESVEREITALEGETRTLKIALTSTKTPQAGHRREPDARGLRWQPWAVVGAGAVITTTGIALWAQDATPSDGEPEPYDYAETTVAGVVTTAVGLGVTGLGVWWVLHDRKQVRAPVVQMNAGGVTLGIVGRF